MTNLMKMTMTMAMKIDNKAMEMIFPTGSGRESLDLHDLFANYRFSKFYLWNPIVFHRLLIVYFHCIGIQRLYIRLWWYGKIISLNPTTTGVEPSERSWRSKEHIFISMRTLIHRVFSRKSGYYTRLQKSGICIFILCALSATRNCVFSCQKKKKNWDD